MGSRERKRAERHKRKRRSAERRRPTPPRAATAARRRDDAFAAVQGENAPPEETFQERMAKRSEARNAEVRAGLEPLAEGERPGAVTVGAVVSAVLALIFTVSAVVAIVGGIEIDGEEPAPAPLVLIAAALWLMAWGMWKARYWAVLGFQMLLLLVILSSALGLVQVSTGPAGDRDAGSARRRGGALLLHDPRDGADPDAGPPRGALSQWHATS